MVPLLSLVFVGTANTATTHVQGHQEPWWHYNAGKCKFLGLILKGRLHKLPPGEGMLRASWVLCWTDSSPLDSRPSLLVKLLSFQAFLPAFYLFSSSELRTQGEWAIECCRTFTNDDPPWPTMSNSNIFTYALFERQMQDSFQLCTYYMTFKDSCLVFKYMVYMLSERPTCVVQYVLTTDQPFHWTYKGFSISLYRRSIRCVPHALMCSDGSRGSNLELFHCPNLSIVPRCDGACGLTCNWRSRNITRDYSSIYKSLFLPRLYFWRRTCCDATRLEIRYVTRLHTRCVISSFALCALLYSFSVTIILRVQKSLLIVLHVLGHSWMVERF